MPYKKVLNHKHKIKIKKGDQVEVISGSNKGQKGEVLQVIPSKNRAIVDGVNNRKKHTKATAENAGGIVDKAAPIDISNLVLLDPATGERTKVGRRLEEGRLVRYSKKSGEIIK
jgi:large subunit ribosomal protein L24